MKAITPVRILDTRGPTGGHPTPFIAGETFTLQVAGRGVPLSGVAAVVLNVTATSATAGAYLRVWNADAPMPLSSTVNFPPSAVVANLCVVPLGPSGAVKIFSYPAGVNVLIDVQGWVAEEPLAPVGPSASLPAAPSSTNFTKAESIHASASSYLMTTWWGTVLPGLVTNLAANDAIRRLSMAALSLSTELLRDPSSTLMRDRLRYLVSTVASNHRVSWSGGWGEGWQTTLWAGLIGRAAWFSWGELTPTTQRWVARLVEFEADWAAAYPIHYLRDVNGVVLTAGDTGAEEVSWHATVLQVAVVMLPTHPHATLWEAELRRYALAAWARPQDAVSLGLRGSNVEANGQVVNHSRIAPDYATCTYQNCDAVPCFVLAGRAVPWETIDLLAPVYAALEALYVPSTAQVSYPAGSDWGTSQAIPFALVDAQARTYGYDTTGHAEVYLGLHLDAVLAQQARHTDGHTYEPGEYPYPGCEEHTAQLASQVVLTLALGAVTFD